MIAAVRACELTFTDDQTIELFQKMDKDGDAVLQLSEFHAYCKADPDWAAEGLNKRSKSGREITPGGEIVTKIFENSESGDFRIVEIFFLVDTDGSGEMDQQEFEVAIEMMGLDLTPTEMELAFNELDEDGGGTIEIEEFMARMRREKKWKREDAEHEREFNAKEQEARLIEGLSGEAKQVAIENAGASAWEMARMRMQLQQWKDEGEHEHEDEDYAAFQREELEAQLAEAAHAKEEEEAQLAEEAHAREEQEALEAEAQLAREEAEAQEALEAAKQEEIEAKLAADKAEKEMREAIAAEKKAVRERQQAAQANAKLEKERREAVEAQKHVDALALNLQEFINGPLAEAQQMHHDAWGDMEAAHSIQEHDSQPVRRRRGSKVTLDWADSSEFSAGDKARMQQADIHLRLQSEKKQRLENELSEAERIAAKELAEAVEAEKDAIRETMEAEEAEKTAQRERQEAIEAQQVAVKEQAEAVEARRIAQKEMDDVAEARDNAERERREAEEAKAVAQRERDEADEARAIALKERKEADEAKLKYYSKVARKFGIRWRDKAKVRGAARRKEERRLRREMIAAAPPTPSVVQKMLSHVGAECYRWEAEVANEVSVDDPEQIASRARELQGLRKEYIVAMAKERRRQHTQTVSGKLPLVGRLASATTDPAAGFGTSASFLVPASIRTTRGRCPTTPTDPRSNGGSLSDRERGSARRRRAESWAVRGAGGTLSSARDSARRANSQVTFTSSFDHQSLSKVVQFRSDTRHIVRFPTAQTVEPAPPGMIRCARLPPPPPSPARVLEQISVRDAALLNAFEKSSSRRASPVQFEQ